MLSPATITAQIRRLHGAGLDWAPDAKLAAETRSTWMDVLGDLQDGELDDAVRAHLSGPDGHRWPTPAAIRGLVLLRRREEAPAAPTACPACHEGGRRIVQLWRRQGRLVEEVSVVACSCLAGECWARTLSDGRPGHRAIRVRTLRDLEQELLHVPAVPVEGDDGWIAWWVAPSRYATPTWEPRAQAELNAQVGRPGRAGDAAITAALAKLGRTHEAPRGRLSLAMPPTVEATVRAADRNWQDRESERWAV